MKEIFYSDESDLLSRDRKLRIVLTGSILGTIFILLSVFQANQYIKKIEEERLTNLKQMVQIARNTIEPILIRYRTGEMGREEALEDVRTLVSKMVYGEVEDENYLFMSSYDGVMLVQPFEPHMEMTNQWDLKDDHGRYIIRGLVETARAHEDGGYFTYHYHSPSHIISEEKVSYVMGIPELDSYIGTGKYMGDIRDSQTFYLLKMLGLDSVFILFLILLIRFSLQGIKSQNKALHEEINLRRETEQELIKHQNNLEQLMEEQTREIKENEENYYKLFENANDAIFIIKGAEFIDCNKKTVEIFGCEKDEIIHRTPMDFSPVLQPDGGSSEEKGMEKLRLALENKSQFFEWEHRRFDGSTFYADVSLNRIEIGGEGVLLAIVRDITARKNIEEEREKLIEELQEALDNIKTLKGLLPICAKCKKVRDDKGYWSQIEGYIESHSEALFSHGLCPDCEKELYGDQEWYKKGK